jgi:hypothetical protein
MRVACLVLALAFVSAAGAATARERDVAGPLSTIAIAGTEIAYAHEYKRGCHEVRLWTPESFADRRLASHCFVGTSTGSGVAGAMGTGRRALWLTYTGGNIREWSLWTKAIGGKARRIQFAAADVDGPAPIVLGRPAEGVLPYAVGRRILALSDTGARVFSLLVRDRVVSLSAYKGGFAAVLADGAVLEIRPGRPIVEHAYPAGAASEAVLTVTLGLIVKTKAGLDVRKGGSVQRFPLPAGARFLGYADGRVAYGVGVELRLRDLDGRHDRLVRRFAGPRYRAQFGPRGLAYASGRTLGFRTIATL